jgi:hypothetical protein
MFDFDLSIAGWAVGIFVPRLELLEATVHAHLVTAFEFYWECGHIRKTKCLGATLALQLRKLALFNLNGHRL